MKIENLRSENKNSRARVVATITWEDCDRPAKEFYFETEEEFGDGLSCNPHAFLIPCALAAMHHGEERVFIDAAICPRLRDGLMTAMSWIRHWYAQLAQESKLVRIDARTQKHVSFLDKPPRAGLFLSGGIDSLATLRANRLNYPLEHPGSIKDGLIVYGLEIIKPESFQHVLSSLSKIAQDARVTLIPVYTNIRYLEEDWHFWETHFMGAVFSAIAHAFARQFTVVSIASSDPIPDLQPYGSHPLLDPNYSSSDLRIRHEGITLSRLDRTKLLADWDVAIKNLRVCNKSEHYQVGMLNCGECEKCIRTKLAVLVAGVLEKTPGFTKQEISVEFMKSIYMKEQDFGYYRELIAPLAAKGYDNLARVIERRMASFYEPQWKKKLKRWTVKPLANFDKRYLEGNLRKCKRLVYP
jgi:hypothetical protein